ncbi:hypothetical protein [Candidatus Symbiothrix dinenymphae]|uniref:hypothetical protein n=1 Tax=Candidatus Symbiothrix dinenymphae TaxID=467085 RepID=UPI0006E1EC85|nr:hypothetical protein [Candidatus Symbiothrix dinenymphae]
MKRKLNFENVLSQHLWHIREKSLYALRPVIILVVLFAGYMTYNRMTAELNVVQQYDKSLAIAHECERLWADYDWQWKKQTILK